MERISIMEEYISCRDMNSIMCDIETYHRAIKTDESLRRSLAEKIILTEKEKIRMNAVIHYKLYKGVPEILELVDRDALVDAYIADGHYENYDSVDEMCEDLYDEAYKVCKWLESFCLTLFEDKDRLANSELPE